MAQSVHVHIRPDQPAEHRRCVMCQREPVMDSGAVLMLAILIQVKTTYALKHVMRRYGVRFQNILKHITSVK
jgi:hypothetical protein